MLAIGAIYSLRPLMENALNFPINRPPKIKLFYFLNPSRIHFLTLQYYVCVTTTLVRDVFLADPAHTTCT